MKKIIPILFLFLSANVFAQTPSESKPTIHVTGTAKVNITPDLGVLSIAVSEIKPTMSDALKALGDKSNYYNDLFKKMGFKEKDIKTTNFTVSKHRIYRYNDYVDSGYIASQNIRLEFTYDQKTIQKMLGEFAKSEKPIDFSFSFELSEALKQKVQTQVLELAVKDATEKANGIAKSAGLKLVKIQRINYGVTQNSGNMDQITRMDKFAMTSEGDFSSFNFTPQEIVFIDTLTIEWIIE